MTQHSGKAQTLEIVKISVVARGLWGVRNKQVEHRKKFIAVKLLYTLMVDICH